MVKSEAVDDTCVFTRFLRLLNFPNFSREIAVFNSQAVQSLRVFTIFSPCFEFSHFFNLEQNQKRLQKKTKLRMMTQKSKNLKKKKQRLDHHGGVHTLQC